MGENISEIHEQKSVKVYRVDGELRELLGSFDSKSQAIGFARDAAEKDQLKYGKGAGLRFRYSVEVQPQEIHMRIASHRKIVRLGHETIKQLTAAWLEPTNNITKIHNEKMVGGRKLDLMLENPFTSPRFRIFVEVETKPVKDAYVQKFLRFCKREKPSKAYIITPIASPQEMGWRDSKLSYHPKLYVVPTRDVLKQVQELYTMKFDTLEGDVILALNPDKVWVIQAPVRE